MTVRSPHPSDAASPTGRVLEILSAVERVGLDADEVLAEAGLRTSLTKLLRRGEEALSLSTCTAIACAALDRVEIEAAGRSHVAPPYVHQRAMIWYGTTSCAVVSNVIGLLQAYSKMLAGAGGVGDIQLHAGRVILPISSLRSARDPVNFLADVFGSICVRNMLSWLIGERLSHGTFELNYPSTFSAYAPEGLVDCDIHWDQPAAAISFPESLMNSPVVRTGADFVAMQPMALLLMDDVRRVGPFAFSVARVFDDAIANGRTIPGGAKVADRLGCSMATLRRRLTEEGTSLLSIKNDRRREWAITLLRIHTISEVARRLGFSDETSFRRAFRQWTGRSPSSFR